MATTNLGKVSLTPRGGYNSSTQYERLDIVGYKGSSYIILKPCKGIPPTGDDITSMLMSKCGENFKYTDFTPEQLALLKGDKGAAGADGKDGRDGKDFEVPTLSIAPSESTLSYTSGSASIAFRIGQLARYLDTDKGDAGEFVFYQLYDIKNGKAVWKLSSGELGDLSSPFIIRSSKRPRVYIGTPNTGTPYVYEDIAYLSDIPSPPDKIVYDVTEMFITSAPVSKFRAEMEDWGDGKPMIQLYGQDESGTDNPLVITAAKGFGSAFDLTGKNSKLALGMNANGAAEIYPIPITPETEATQTAITYPPEVKDIDLRYWLGSTAYRGSYWIDAKGVYHLFNRSNTPLRGFIPREEDGKYVIAGTPIEPAALRDAYIKFGDDYLVEMVIPDATGPGSFLNVWLAGLDLRGLRNVETVGFEALSGLRNMVLDLSSWTKVRRIKESAFAFMDNTHVVWPAFENEAVMEHYAAEGWTWSDTTPPYVIDLSTFGNVTNMGDYVLGSSNTAGDERVIVQLGGVDWSAKTMGAGCCDFYTVNGELHADSLELAQAFLAKINLQYLIHKWPIVINGTGERYTPTTA